MIDLSTVDWPVTLTAILALLIALGGAWTLNKRGKFVGAIGTLTDTLVDVAQLMTDFSNAIADDKIEQVELDIMKAKALEIKNQMIALKAELGV